MQTAWQVIVDGLAFLSNLVTVLLGAIALIGVFWHRKKISAFFTLLATSHLQERINRIKETLGKLESLNYDVKEDRPKILAIIGQLSGQVRPLSSQNQEIDAVYKEINSILNKDIRLSEAVKMRILHEVHGALDKQALAASSSLMGHQK
ncbi:MAG: hypothetical protein L0Y72_18190 [Gemmataceae bacterium]|nr:hypothetical protein [Gemmataceae bacterium]MCI0740981.1 hypothetical protein [Gemmataceae bacterium]